MSHWWKCPSCRSELDQSKWPTHCGLCGDARPDQPTIPSADLTQRVDALRTELAEHTGREDFCSLCRVARHLDYAFGELIGEPIEAEQPSQDEVERVADLVWALSCGYADDQGLSLTPAQCERHANDLRNLLGALREQSSLCEEE